MLEINSLLAYIKCIILHAVHDMTSESCRTAALQEIYSVAAVHVLEYAQKKAKGRTFGRKQQVMV